MSPFLLLPLSQCSDVLTLLSNLDHNSRGKLSTPLVLTGDTVGKRDKAQTEDGVVSRKKRARCEDDEHDQDSPGPAKRHTSSIKVQPTVFKGEIQYCAAQDIKLFSILVKHSLDIVLETSKELRPDDGLSSVAALMSIMVTIIDQVRKRFSEVEKSLGSEVIKEQVTTIIGELGKTLSEVVKEVDTKQIKARIAMIVRQLGKLSEVGKELELGRIKAQSALGRLVG